MVETALIGLMEGSYHFVRIPIMATLIISHRRLDCKHKATEVQCGTDIKITQEGIPEMIPAEMCYLGWQDSLDKLKRLVEPNLPDA